MDKQTHWFSLIEECEQGSASQKQYCREKGLPYSTFMYWRHKYLKGRIGEQADSGHFISIDTQSTPPLELIYPNGVRLQLPAGTSPAHLSALIRLY